MRFCLFVFCLCALVYSDVSRGFESRTRFSSDVGYSRVSHLSAFYNPFYQSSETSVLTYSADSPILTIDLDWGGYWYRQKAGFFTRFAASGAGSVLREGTLIDQDYCAGSVGFAVDGNPYTCTSAATLWSETSHDLQGWHARAEGTAVLGVSYKTRVPFSLGFASGYGYLREQFYSKGTIIRVRLPTPFLVDGVVRDAGEDVIGNLVEWHYVKFGTEFSVGPLSVSAGFYPYASYREEDSHFLRAGVDLGPVPNVISTGSGTGTYVESEIAIPVGKKGKTKSYFLLSGSWQRLWMLEGTRIYKGVDIDSLPFDMTRFTTERWSARLGFLVEWRHPQPVPRRSPRSRRSGSSS